jgi:hypothetical protein
LILNRILHFFIRLILLKKILLAFLTLVIFLVIDQYLFCPYYKFPRPEPFSGDQLYNPYNDSKPISWGRANFHAHSNAWFGFTNGKGKAADIWNKYDSLGYSIHAISEYQKINEDFKNEINYIPAYEHGFNFKKAHQLILGGHHILWSDYIFPQTLSNKQNILNRLNNDDSSILILNHPRLRKAYSCDDLTYLANYQCLEVLNPTVCSFSQWDAALSNGHPVFIVGNDDTHHILDSNRVGRECTWINSSHPGPSGVLKDLRTGKSYAMHIAEIPGEPENVRIERIRKHLPVLRKFELHDDTIRVAVTKKATSIDFIGQNGKILKTIFESASGSYLFQSTDHYVRIAITFNDHTAIYLNPVFRFSTDNPLMNPPPQVNQAKTLLFILAGSNLLILWLLFVYKVLFTRKINVNNADLDYPDFLI